MALRTLSRKVKIELLNQECDISELLFANRKAQKVCMLFLAELKRRNGMTRHELHQFAVLLETGGIQSDFRYSKTRFYVQIRKTLLTLGLIGIHRRAVDSPEPGLSPERSRRRDVIDKYVPVHQPIAKRAPDGLNLVRLTWIICEKWNREFSDVLQCETV